MAISFSKAFIKVFGSRNERLLKRYHRIVETINSLEPKVQALDDAGLLSRSQELRTGLMGKKLQPLDVLPEAFAIIREAMDRNIGIRSIFNPEENFDPDKFDDKTLALYDAVQQKMIQSGESWQKVAVPNEIYAAVRVLYPESRPPFRARCFDVQMIGGLVLYEGKIAEMATGEGKTFVAPLASFMKVLEGFHSHTVTVNDYLVRRDALWIRPAFEALGFTVGYIQSDMEPGGETRKRQYEHDVTYGTNSEFGFDFLRDNMKERADLQVQGPLDFAIVDEVDSILIDEARTPLIISGAAHDDAPKYRAADLVARKILELHKPYSNAEKAVDTAKRAIKSAQGDEEKTKTKEEKEAARARATAAEQQLVEAEANLAKHTQFYEVELDRKSVHLTHEGIAAAQEAAGVGSFYVGNNMEWPHLMEQSLRAHVVYERDKDYVVERGTGPRATGEMEVVIVDEFTGRKMVGRQWSDGLHQAVEAKERVPIKQESQTLATITLQNFFKLYKSLAGMTGTAQTESEEFMKIYKLEVVTIPTNRPNVRADSEDRVYRTEREKWEAIIEEIKEESDKGRPILVGTTSVEKSEMLSNALMRKYGVQHEVLNAKQHEREAPIVAMAGQQHKNAHGEIVGNVTIATNMAGRGTDIKPSQEALKSGGLHVVATERHTARRIDNQLRGRSGRQGDPGSSRFYVSLQDELMKLFAGEWTIKVLGFLGMEEGMAIEDKRISKGILRAQKKVEERNYLARKNLLDYDEVMDYQRTIFYGMRQQVLEGRGVDDIIWSMIGDSIKDAVNKYVTEDYVAATIVEWARQNFDVALEPGDLKGMRKLLDLEEYIKNQSRAEAETGISATLGEFMGEGGDSSADWDTKGLSSWAMSKYHVNLSQSQLRKMNAAEVEDALKHSALEMIDERDCSALTRYLGNDYALHEMCNWAREKFGVQAQPEEFKNDAQVKPSDEIIDMLQQRARQAYHPREVEYPVDQLLTVAFGDNPGGGASVYGLDYVRAWSLAKYGVDLALAELQAMTLVQLRDKLVGLQREFLEGDRLDAIVDAIISANPNATELASAANQRFATRFKPDDLSTSGSATSGSATNDADGEDERDERTPREKLLEAGQQFMRRELTDLEQFVLIQIFDQSWKDHLYAMDMLRNSIGLQAFAEKDPRIAYKKEGYRFFEEMMIGVRGKVTDLIFRARVVGQPQQQARSNYRETAAVHQTSDDYGVAENVAATAGVSEGVPPNAESGDSEQAVKVKTIQRQGERVGRNDPCPCGSGKKYKKCHGMEVA